MCRDGSPSSEAAEGRASMRCRSASRTGHKIRGIATCREVPEPARPHFMGVPLPTLGLRLPRLHVRHFLPRPQPRAFFASILNPGMAAGDKCTVKGGCVMNKSCRWGTIAAIATLIAATGFDREACANPFAWLAQPLFGYGTPTDNGNQVRADLRRRLVHYRGSETPGTIIIDTPNPYPYLVLPCAKANRHG